mgnify:CR=1 FL=1
MSVIIAKQIIKKQPIEKQTEAKFRNLIGVIASIVGIIANCFIGVAKLVVGLIFSSISVASDGLNNISDTASSAVSLISFKIADKPADKKHPFGHARAEYLAAMIISFIIIMLGIELVKSSIEKIIENTASTFSFITIGILIFSIAVKIILFAYNFAMFKKIKSSTLKGVAIDCINDCLVSSVILISTLISHYLKVNLDGYFGIIVALIIIIQGIKLMISTFNPLLGEKADKQMVIDIAKAIQNYDGVLGLHDMIVHNYGPNRYFVSVHVEVDCKQDMLKSHELIDTIERELTTETTQLLIHMDPINKDDEESNKYKQMIASTAKQIDEKITIHDFRMVKGVNNNNLIFDIVLPMEFKLSDADIIEKLKDLVKEQDTTCNLVINVDRNYTEC